MMEVAKHFLLQTERGREVAYASLGVLGVSIIFVVFHSVWQWHHDWVLTHTPEAATSSVSSMQLAEAAITQLPKRHLFGQNAEDEADFLPITSLQIHVTGIVKANDDRDSTALIVQSGGVGQVYHIGDELTDGIRIYAVNMDSVILEHRGRLEKLPLSRAPLLFQDKPEGLWSDSQ